jgi:sulfur transfer complex TusBCD TusB component (DsrH family)
MSGRVLVESGTFISAAVGAAVASKADAMQSSIGFSHPPGEPDAEGVFTHIRRFERSLVPAGRAANPLTALVVKGVNSVDTNKIEALKALLGADAVNEILAAAGATQQKADTAGTAYKAAAPPAPAEIVIGGVVYAVKAPPIVATALDMIEQPVPEAEGEAAEMAEDVAEGADNMLLPGEIDAIAEAVAQKMMALLDTISAKMGAIDEEMKARGYARAKSDEALTAVTSEVVSLRRAVAELSGDQPLAAPHRASAAVATVVSPERAKELGANVDGSTIAQVGADENFFQFITSGAGRRA